MEVCRERIIEIVSNVFHGINFLWSIKPYVQNLRSNVNNKNGGNNEEEFYVFQIFYCVIVRCIFCMSHTAVL